MMFWQGLKEWKLRLKYVARIFLYLEYIYAWSPLKFI